MPFFQVIALELDYSSIILYLLAVWSTLVNRSSPNPCRTCSQLSRCVWHKAFLEKNLPLSFIPWISTIQFTYAKKWNSLFYYSKFLENATLDDHYSFNFILLVLHLFLTHIKKLHWISVFWEFTFSSIFYLKSSREIQRSALLYKHTQYKNFSS